MPNQKQPSRPQAPPERYPAVRQDEAVERTGHSEDVAGEDRGFDGEDGPAPIATSDGRLGARSDPAEGKRR